MKKVNIILVIMLITLTGRIAFSQIIANPPENSDTSGNNANIINQSTATPDDPSLNFSPVSNREVKVQLGGSFETYFELNSMRRRSPFYLINFYKDSREDSYLTLFQGDLNLNLDFVYDKIEFHFKTQTQYINPGDLTFKILEGLNRINFSQKFMTEIGIIRFAWGKGAFTNPVGFINPKKDPLETTKLYEGVPSFHFQYQTTWNNSALKSFAINAISVFDYATVNEKYGKLDNFKFAGKIYLLFYDTDLDFIAYGGKNEPLRLGFDFSRNLGPAIEIHGELVYYHHFKWSYIDNSGVIIEKKVNRIAALAGIKVAFPKDINFTLEYFYNGLGYNSSEYSNLHNFTYDVYGYLMSGTSIAGYSSFDNLKNSTGKVFFTRHYVYVNLSQTDVFSIKYLNVSLSFIINLQDKSMVIYPAINYSPYPNLDLQLYLRWYLGKTVTEFGDVHTQFVIGLKVKISF